MKKIVLIIILPAILLGKLSDIYLKPGKRGNNYRVWIYFNDKESSSLAFISDRALQRRKKNKISSKADWYDKDISSIYLKAIKNLGIHIKSKSNTKIFYYLLLIAFFSWDFESSGRTPFSNVSISSL